MKFGLIGHPISDSKSPELFARAYDSKWPYDLIEGADFEESWQKFLSDYQAINITAPFKEKAFAKVAETGTIAPECAAIGAINIAVKTPEGIVGYNSDFLGVRKILEDNDFGPDLTALVVGYGGAGKAAAAAARSLGMDVVICNRSIKAEGIRPLEEAPLIAEVSDIMIYTLPVPIKGIYCGCILEANYKSPCYAGTTADYIPGTEWLKSQAVTGYALMTGEDPNL